MREKMRAIELFVDVSKLFMARLLKPLWEKHPDWQVDRLDALSIFLDGYAFERQGRNPDYSYAAVEALEVVKHSSPGQISPSLVWDKFSESLERKGLNEKLNPLYHEQGTCHCVWCVLESENIIRKSAEDITEGRVKIRCEKIKKIRGVGPKISSLFLRDVAVQAVQFPLIAPKDHWLLQPVDIWIRRTVRLLAGDEKMKDEDVAKWMVCNCTKPELANQGIWYFGAQIAESKLRLYRAIKDMDYAQRIYREHIMNLKAAIEAIEN